MEIDPPRNNRLQLIETVSSRGRSNQTPRPRPINFLTGLIDCPCLRKLMRQAAAQPPPYSYLSFIPQLVPDPASPAQSGTCLTYRTPSQTPPTGDAHYPQILL